MRVLWLYGPQAVGKSVTAWELLNTMAAREPATGYVDIDQLGMLHVEDGGGTDDADGCLLEGRALAAVAAEFAERGVRTLIVSGVLGLELAEFYAEELAPYAPVFVRLSAPHAELRRRLLSRGAYAEEWEVVLEYARSLDASEADHIVVDSGQGTPAEVAVRILAAVGARLDERRGARDAAPRTGDSDALDDSRVLLIGGTTAVGKSTVGWRAFMAAQQQRGASAFADLRQLGFVGVGGGRIDHGLQAATASALWRVFSAYGATTLILNGPVNSSAEMSAYDAAFRGTRPLAVRLTADRSALVERVLARMRGEMAPLAGDALVGRPAAEAEAIAAAALRLQNDIGAHDTLPTLDTTRLDPAESARRLLSDLR